VSDAGGVHSIGGRRAGLIPKRTGTDMILYVTAAVHLGRRNIDERFGDAIEYYLGPGLQHKTWPWIFPKGEVVTLGTGGYMDAGLLGDGCPSIESYMQNFMDQPVVAKKLAGGKVVAWGLHLEFDSVLPQTDGDGVILPAAFTPPRPRPRALPPETSRGRPWSRTIGSASTATPSSRPSTTWPPRTRSRSSRRATRRSPR